MIDSKLLLDVAVRAARAGGKAIREGAVRPIDVRSKGLRDLLTDVDLTAERAIVDTIRAWYPDHDILTEETPPGERRSRYQWIVDPLDGTGNFCRGLPFYSTSVALAIDDEPVVGAICDPVRGQLFAARRGGGAAVNGEPLQMTRNEDLLQCVIGMDWSRGEKARRAASDLIGDLNPVCGSIRILGSAALGLCYVAAGVLDAYWHLCLSPWDVAAGAVILREVGGKVTTVQGRRWRPATGSCLASNGIIHERIVQYARVRLPVDVPG